MMAQPRLGRTVSGDSFVSDFSQPVQQPAVPSFTTFDPAANQPNAYPPQNTGQAFFSGFEQFAGSTYAQVGQNLGAKIIGDGQQAIQSNISRFVSIETLRHYFNISNNYVINKLRLVLCPFLKKGAFQRQMVNVNVEGNSSGASFLPPRDDLFAPDLYIPLMAFITFALVIGFIAGFTGNFSPEVLYLTCSSALGMLLFEVLLVKFGLYLLSVQSGLSFLDCVAICGYKFVGMIPIPLFGLFFGGLGFTCALLYCGLSQAVFVIKTLRVFVMPQATVATTSLHSTNNRNYFLLFIGLLQILISYMLASQINV
eukprot:GCRY01001286.1.p1 GENE.GCRY01001286.1~~GCRY01001286.1.p1  ORF type:complete len:312 (+),score=45.66 GCRY01001286.1:76-1011(+)